MKIVKNKYREEFYDDYGNLHREDGPAVIYPSGISYWYKNGKIHREDGPAIHWADGTFSWYVNGVIASNSKPFIKLLIEFKINKNKVLSIAARNYLDDKEEMEKLKKLT